MKTASSTWLKGRLVGRARAENENRRVKTEIIAGTPALFFHSQRKESQGLEIRRQPEASDKAWECAAWR